MTDLTNKLLIVTGPTATGKTSLAANLAYELNGEVISADSRQVFKGMTIGTGKDYGDYIVKGHEIPSHLVDIREAGDTYSVFEFQKDFITAYNSITSRGKYALLCGGTGLYIDSVVKKYNLLDVPRNEQLRDELKDKTLDELSEILAQLKEMHNKTDIDTKQRAIRAIEIELYQKGNKVEKTDMPEFHYLIVAPSFDRPQIRKRITQRLHERLDDGMVEEVKNLIDHGIPPEKLISYGLEYKYITWYIMGELTEAEMKEKLNIAIHQFAKRQMTWFRRMERSGTKIYWIDGYLPMVDKVKRVLDLFK